jgi:hypothetical protein
MTRAKPSFDQREIQLMFDNNKYKNSEAYIVSPVAAPPSIQTQLSRSKSIHHQDVGKQAKGGGKGWVELNDFLRFTSSLLGNGISFELQTLVMQQMSVADSAVNTLSAHWGNFLASYKMITEFAATEVSSSSAAGNSSSLLISELERTGEKEISADPNAIVISQATRERLHRHNQAFLSIIEHIQYLLEREMTEYRLLSRNQPYFQKLADASAKRMIALYRSLLFIILSHQNTCITDTIPLSNERITTLHSDLQILENLCVKQHASAVAVRERLQYSEANSSSGLSRQPTNASRQPTRTASISSISRVPTSTNTTLSRQPTLTKS